MAIMKLVVFDVDGTLVDSQAHISKAMRLSFERHGLRAPETSHVKSIIGLSLAEALQKMVPEGSHILYKKLIDTYVECFISLRESPGYEPSPLFYGIRDLLDRLSVSGKYLLGIATGKGRRGLDYIIESHFLDHYFSTIQTADNHPSKPHPSMLYSTLDETGLCPEDAVIIGDTSYDMDMGEAAKFNRIGVSWGYHSSEIMIPKSDFYVNSPDEIDDILKNMWNDI
jgi:phosphoglycolate phosphatase